MSSRLSASVLLLACLARAGTLHAGEEHWDALGPQRIGAAHAEISAARPMQCEGEQLRTCALRAGTFARVPVSAVQAQFRDGRLERVTVRLEEGDYPALLARLRERLGEPEDRSFRARAGMAGEFDAGVKLWTQGDVTLVLEQFAGKIDRSALTFGTAEAMRELVAAKRAYPPGAARDL